MVESHPDLMLAGQIEAIDLGASTFTVMGIAVAVDDSTEFETAFPTFAPVDELADLAVGNIVKVDASLPGGRVLATHVLVVAPDVPQPPVMLRGTVKSITDTAWVITSGSEDTTVAVDRRTKITGNPQVGDEVQVIAQRNGEGSLVALAILKIGPIGPQKLEFRGWVTSISASEWQIGGPPGIPTPTVTVRITSTTQIYPDPKVGDLVNVRGTVGLDRIVVADSITKPPR